MPEVVQKPSNVTEVKSQAPIRADVLIETLIEQRNNALNTVALLSADKAELIFKLEKSEDKVNELTALLSSATAPIKPVVVIDQPVVEGKQDGQGGET